MCAFFDLAFLSLVIEVLVAALLNDDRGARDGGQW
jgi:hypothetical protein